jgi:hypothetical protein
MFLPDVGHWKSISGPQKLSVEYVTIVVVNRYLTSSYCHSTTPDTLAQYMGYVSASERNLLLP